MSSTKKPQKFKVIYLDDAKAALRSIYKKHLALVGVNSASNITEKIQDKVELLTDSPFMGSVPKQKALAALELRKLVCGVYICFYRVNGDVVEIVDIVDGRTNYIKRFISRR